MPWWDGWWGPGSWMPLFPLGFVAICLILMVFMMSGMMRHRSHGGALDILNERFARGEIDRSEYEEKRRAIAG